MKELMLLNEYQHNSRFKDYVDKYCKYHQVSLDEAFKQELVRQVYLYYTEV